MIIESFGSPSVAHRPCAARPCVPICFLAVVALLAAASVDAAEIDPAAREKLGDRMKKAVASGEAAGISHLVFRGDDFVHFTAEGVADIETGQPFRRDTIVRIYSMTKPIVSVAAMTLYQQRKFELDDPVSKFIPAISEMKVLTKNGEHWETVAPRRPVTVRDVLRHTTGWAYGGAGIPAWEKHYRREGMKYQGPHAMFPPEMTIGEAAEALAKIPTFHHPGQRFTYGFNTDLLGRLIEVWSGESLDTYLQDAVLGPLQMNDTGFSVPAEKVARFASCHTHKDGKLAIADRAGESPFVKGFSFLSGGGGLVSTIDDYAKFCRMLVNEGRAGETQILEPDTVRLMFQDQLEEAAGDFRFGLGFALAEVTLGSGADSRSAKQCSWGGYASTEFRILPEEKLVQIVFRQHVPMSTPLGEQLLELAYQGYRAAPESADSLPANEARPLRKKSAATK